MKYIYSLHSDIGISSKTNDDAVAFKSITASSNDAVLCVLCDGMGGYEKGNVASSSVVNTFIKWFDNEFLKLINVFNADSLKSQWNFIIQDINSKIIKFGRENKIQLGTTLTAILFFNNYYYCIHVGDTRLYKITNKVEQITKDHSVVWEMYENQEIKFSEIETHPDRNQLTRCIGIMRRVDTDFYCGELSKNDVFLLCTDGFRHEISQEEMFELLNPNLLNKNEDIKTSIIRLTERAETRHEEDNITSAVIKII